MSMSRYQLIFFCSFAALLTGIALGYVTGARSDGRADTMLINGLYEDRALAVVADLDTSSMILKALDKGDVETARVLAAQQISVNVTYAKLQTRIRQTSIARQLESAISAAEPLVAKNRLKERQQR